MRVWISGLAGFLGSHVADACLAAGHTVGGNDNLSGGDVLNVPTGAYFKNFDCLGNTKGVVDFDYCWKAEHQFGVPDVLVHCAALAHEGLSSFSPHLITQSIFGASLRTFSQAIAHGVKRIVFMSSMSRYGEGAGSYDPTSGYEKTMAPFHEWHETNPVDPYAVSKVAAEECLEILCETHKVKWSICVPHSLIGTRQRYIDPYRNVCSIMINRCLRGLPPIVYGSGSQKRSFSPVKDCLPSIMKMINGEADYEVVNIGPDGNEMTIWELATKIMRLTGLEGTPIRVPPRPNEVDQAYCSSDKVRRLLGYKEVQTLDECLIEMIEDIRRLGPRPFDWHLPIEIKSDLCPKTWSERKMDE